MQATMTVAAPAAWNQPAYRACFLCDHGVGPKDDTRRCRCTAVAGRQELPVHIARAPHGPCGPEANFLRFPGLTTN